MNLKIAVSALLVLGTCASSFAATAQEQEAREARIRSLMAKSEDHVLIVPAKISATAEDLKSWGVVAHWNFFSDADSFVDDVQGLRLESKFDEKLEAVSGSPGLARSESCSYHASQKALTFQRGQYLELSQADSTLFTFHDQESITVGGWIKARSDQFSQTTISGWLPFFSKMPKNGEYSAGDWEFMSAGNLIYLAVHRKNAAHLERSIYSTSMSSAWWADDPASCYAGGRHVECWHFITLSIDVSKQLPEGRTTLFRDFVVGNSVSTDYTKSSILPIGSNSHASMNDPKSRVRVATNQLDYFQGQIGSLFFAKKALTPEQLKAIANLNRCK